MKSSKRYLLACSWQTQLFEIVWLLFFSWSWLSQCSCPFTEAGGFGREPLTLAEKGSCFWKLEIRVRMLRAHFNHLCLSTIKITDEGFWSFVTMLVSCKFWKLGTRILQFCILNSRLFPLILSKYCLWETNKFLKRRRTRDWTLDRQGQLGHFEWRCFAQNHLVFCESFFIFTQ